MNNDQTSTKNDSSNTNTNTDVLYSQSINSIDSKPMDLDKFKGKTVLFVNIATQCGYTGQLGGLEELYQKYKTQGLEVVGIPSNDFGGQTPEAANEVKDFCKLNYGVTFPLTEKSEVKSPKEKSLPHWLTQSSDNKSAVKWNFEKFLVGKDGKLIQRYASAVKPNDSELLKAIEGNL